jgi:bacterioferritin-associated ferredoxin
MENFREFSCAPDPFGRTWQVWFKWLQTAISIRHSDSVDVKFILRSDDETIQKTISMPHLTLRELAAGMGVAMSDAWCARLARQHLEHLVSSAEDMEKDIVTPSLAQLTQYAETEKRWEADQVRSRRGAA